MKPTNLMMKLALSSSAFALISSSAFAADIKSFDTDGGPSQAYLGSYKILGASTPSGLPGGGPLGIGGALPPAVVGLSFNGVSELDSASVNGGSINVPPDTMGAIGATQFMETSNSAYAVYDKVTGARTELVSGSAFWAAAGITGFGGDSRVRFDSVSNRWIATALSGGADHNVNIAISNTADATGGWKGVTLNGFPAGIADYPTLAIDNNAVYIGTNNFTPSGGSYSYSGTSLFVIPRTSMFSAAPSLTNTVRFDNGAAAGVPDRGFAIQGLNNTDSASKNGGVIADSLYTDQLTHYSINNAGTAGATQTAPVDGIGPDYAQPSPARQPNGTRHIDTLDTRVGSSAWLQNGKIYTVFTVDDGTDHSAVNWEVVDAKTNAVLGQGLISGGGYDYYQGSLAVNASGQVVIGYNRSGYDKATGDISIFARTFDSTAGGGLVQTGSDLLLHQSALGTYNNHEFGAGVNRWGDYSAVTLDPSNSESFWVVGEYQGPNIKVGSGDTWSTWGTWVSDVVLSPVPEPSTWAMMLVGLGLIGGTMRRRNAVTAA